MARIAQIVSTARYLPPHLVSNAELTERFTALGRPHVIDKLAASTGISKRFYVPNDWVTSDLALMAAKEALKRAGRKPEDIDLIILGTTSPDYITPATSVVLQHKLGATNAGAFDVDCACAAFPALLAIGAGLITTNPAVKTVLLVGVDMIHRLTDKNDAGSFFWSAGAGAAVLEGGNAAGFIGAASGRWRLRGRMGHYRRRHLRTGECRRRQGPPHHDAARSWQLSRFSQRR
jgi:3-oxoacyl-[acyl-carrier-protein] synthase-3